MLKHMITVLTVMLAVGGFTGTGQSLAGHWIVGSISIRNEAGHNEYGERLSVFLVSDEIPVSAKKCIQEINHQRKVDCINNCHLDFYKRFQQKQQRP